MNNIAGLLFHTGAVAEARKRYGSALAIRQKLATHSRLSDNTKEIWRPATTIWELC